MALESIYIFVKIQCTKVLQTCIVLSCFRRSVRLVEPCRRRPNAVETLLEALQSRPEHLLDRLGLSEHPMYELVLGEVNMATASCTGISLQADVGRHFGAPAIVQSLLLLTEATLIGIAHFVAQHAAAGIVHDHVAMTLHRSIVAGTVALTNMLRQVGTLHQVVRHELEEG